MDIKTIFKKKHELWLLFLYGSLSLEDEEIYHKIYDFSKIFYYHLDWIGKEATKKKIKVDYNIDKIDFKSENNYQLFFKLIDNLENISLLYQKIETPLFQRIRNDEEYILNEIKRFIKNRKNSDIRAFDRSLKIKNKNLDKIETEALITFLIEENYKEYELILTYTYSNFFTDNKELSNIFSILIEESHFHLKSFARIMSKLGILTIPRQIMPKIYQFEDINKFLEDGIIEEENAKEQCLTLSSQIKDIELSQFFDFINNQESYHIELMREAVKVIQKK